MRIIVVKDRSRGDFSNVLGIGNVLSEKLGEPATVIKLNAHGNYLLPLLKIFLHRGASNLLNKSDKIKKIIFSLFFSGEYPGNEGVIAVVSTLGRGEAAGAFIGCYWDATTIHLGSPKRLQRKLFSAVIAHAGNIPKENEIKLPITPTKMRLALRNQPARSKDAKHICLLVGGDAPKVAYYDKVFWNQVVKIAITIAESHQASLTVISSPRSGVEVENYIDRMLSQCHSIEIKKIYYCHGDKTDLLPEIASADIVMVTAESTSMLSDAIASGAYVIALHHGAILDEDRVKSFLRCQEAASTLKSINVLDWDGTPISVDELTPLEICWSEVLWSNLKPVFE